MKILVVNAGSSSVKFKLYDMRAGKALAEGNCQRVELENSVVTYRQEGADKQNFVLNLPDHNAALSEIFRLLCHGETGVLGGIGELDAVGHRVSMGGARYVSSVLVDDEVIRAVEELGDITPLHNPPQARVIRACRELLGDSVPMVAGFDTAFHQTMPEVSYLYPIPIRYAEQYGLRRFGFHGLSHQYVVERYAEIMARPLSGTKIVTCHLGGGSSLTAVKDGRSVDNTFGFGTGQGLPCGTRAGDFDHVAVGYMMRKEGLTYDQAEEVLHRESGLLGISGISSDEKELEDLAMEGNRQAQLALEVLCHNVRKYLGAYAFEMNGLDTVIFTGGIGENSDYLRSAVVKGLSGFGIFLDEEANTRYNRTEHRISSRESKVDIWIIPTNEELVIARDTQRIVEQRTKAG